MRPNPRNFPDSVFCVSWTKKVRQCISFGRVEYETARYRTPRIFPSESRQYLFRTCPTFAYFHFVRNFLGFAARTPSWKFRGFGPTTPSWTNSAGLGVEPRKEGYPMLDEDIARLSPFGHEHINMLGRYSFAVHDAVARSELRPLRILSQNP